MSQPLKDKVAVLTGAAGSIGAASAQRLLEAGARVVITDLDAAGLETVAQRLESRFPGSVAALAGDAADDATVAAVVDLALERFGGLDIAFANAGMFGAAATIVDYPRETFSEVLRVNVVGPFLMCKHALAHMREGGSIIITSSVVGLMSEAGIAGYATSKHALVGLMRTAAKEGAPRAIRVNTIHPGPTDNSFQHRIEMTATGLDEGAAAAAFEQLIPLGRHATAEEIARVVEFLAGPGAGFITGTTISIDGGMTA